MGAVILYRPGYNPQAMADFFKTLESQGGEVPPQWLSDHPNPGNREQAIEKEIRNWPSENYVSNSPAFQKVRQHSMGVKAYTGAEIAQGAKSGEWVALNKKNGQPSTQPAGARQAPAHRPPFPVHHQMRLRSHCRAFSPSSACSPPTSVP